MCPSGRGSRRPGPRASILRARQRTRTRGPCRRWQATVAHARHPGASRHRRTRRPRRGPQIRRVTLLPARRIPPAAVAAVLRVFRFATPSAGGRRRAEARPGAGHRRLEPRFVNLTDDSPAPAHRVSRTHERHVVEGLPGAFRTGFDSTPGSRGPAIERGAGSSETPATARCEAPEAHELTCAGRRRGSRPGTLDRGLAGGGRGSHGPAVRAVSVAGIDRLPVGRHSVWRRRRASRAADTGAPAREAPVPADRGPRGRSPERTAPASARLATWPPTSARERRPRRIHPPREPASLPPTRHPCHPGAGFAPPCGTPSRDGEPLRRNRA